MAGGSKKEREPGRGCATRVPSSFLASAVRYVWDVCASTWKQEAMGMVFPSFFHSRGFVLLLFFFTEGPPCPRHHTKWRKGALSQKRVFIEFVLFARKTNIAYTNKCKVSAVKVL